MINLSILSDMFLLLACPNCSTTNTLKLHFMEGKKKGLARFMQIQRRDCEFKHSFYTSSQIDNTKDNRSKGMKTMEINFRDQCFRCSYPFQIIKRLHKYEKIPLLIPLVMICGSYPLREKCPNTEFFLVLVFPHSD